MAKGQKDVKAGGKGEKASEGIHRIDKGEVEAEERGVELAEWSGAKEAGEGDSEGRRGSSGREDNGVDAAKHGAKAPFSLEAVRSREESTWGIIESWGMQDELSHHQLTIAVHNFTILAVIDEEALIC